MSLNYKPFVIGSLQNNCYLVYDPQTKAAAVIDPLEAVGPVVAFVQENQLLLEKVLVTHAHFDHILGCKALRDEFPSAEIFLHPDDRNLWSEKGNAERFGFAAPDLPLPDHWLQHEETLQLGSGLLQVRHTPGHTPGHVVFYAQCLGCVFCGDLIFRQSVGRTDLPGGDFTQLQRSIEAQIFSLPDDTLLYPGHGPSTTVGEEKLGNPYV
jgi:glyoxylase-like metal-dependent hydrolase (beta-lactamase superfamily II)